MKMNKMSVIFILFVLVWGIATCLLIVRNIHLSKEKERYRENTDALMSDMQQIQLIQQYWLQPSKFSDFHWANTNIIELKM